MSRYSLSDLMRVSNPPLCFSTHCRCFLHRWCPDFPSVLDPNSPPPLYKRFSQPARRFSPSVQLFETPNVCSARRFLLSFERLPSSTLDILRISILLHAYTPPCLFLFLFFFFLHSQGAHAFPFTMSRTYISSRSERRLVLLAVYTQ